jgi:hypothetical protein
MALSIESSNSPVRFQSASLRENRQENGHLKISMTSGRALLEVCNDAFADTS